MEMLQSGFLGSGIEGWEQGGEKLIPIHGLLRGYLQIVIDLHPSMNETDL